MGAMASQITNLTIVYSTVKFNRRSKKTSKLRVTGLCAENSPVTSDFPAQRASNTENFPFDDVIVIYEMTWKLELQGLMVFSYVFRVTKIS